MPPGVSGTLHIDGVPRPLRFTLHDTDDLGQLHLAFDTDAAADVGALFAQTAAAA
jgi:hypothetical protein